MEKKGEWITVDGTITNGNVHPIIRCSVCLEPTTIKTEYCPHCGAKME